MQGQDSKSTVLHLQASEPKYLQAQHIIVHILYYCCNAMNLFKVSRVSIQPQCYAWARTWATSCSRNQLSAAGIDITEQKLKEEFTDSK